MWVLQLVTLSYPSPKNKSKVDKPNSNFQRQQNIYTFFKASLKIRVFVFRPNSQKAQKRLGEFPPGSGLSVSGLGSAATRILNFFGGLYFENFVKPLLQIRNIFLGGLMYLNLVLGNQNGFKNLSSQIQNLTSDVDLYKEEIISKIEVKQILSPSMSTSENFWDITFPRLSPDLQPTFIWPSSDPYLTLNQSWLGFHLNFTGTLPKIYLNFTTYQKLTRSWESFKKLYIF